MVLYNCEKCYKEFSQKSNYLSHINRKKSCIIDDNDNTNIIIYKCNKCNKEFNQKSNYLAHINRKKSCISNDNTNNIILYKCEKCNKEFNKKSNYISHINNKNPCNSNDIIKENKILLDKIKELENVQKNNTQLEKENIQLKAENEKINELYNNLLNKCINSNNTTISSNNTTNNTTTNNNNTTNNNSNNITNNIIKIKLVNFGQEDYTKLTKEEQNNILKYCNRSISNLIRYLHINDKLPQYKNICIKNLRGKGGYLFENNKWTHLNYDVLLMMLFNRKFSDLDKILNENENISKFYKDNIQKLIDNYDDNNVEFIKKNKDNIINLLYNNTKNYKIE
jgi:uncharacterized C2H2 Zn-finger protein